jgi:hypothetical protein
VGGKAGTGFREIPSAQGKGRIFSLVFSLLIALAEFLGPVLEAAARQNSFYKLGPRKVHGRPGTIRIRFILKASGLPHLSIFRAGGNSIRKSDFGKYSFL